MQLGAWFYEEFIEMLNFIFKRGRKATFVESFILIQVFISSDPKLAIYDGAELYGIFNFMSHFDKHC